MITLPLLITWAVGGAMGALGGIFAKKAYTKITKQQAAVDDLHARLNNLESTDKGETL